MNNLLTQKFPITALLMLLMISMSCSHEPIVEPENPGGSNVHGWEDSTINGDATMTRMVFSVNDSIQVVRQGQTRATTTVAGVTTFDLNDAVTIGITGRGTKDYKVTSILTGALTYNGTATDAYCWQSTNETVSLTAWSYGSTTTTADPDNTVYTLPTDQSVSYGELLYAAASDYDYASYKSGISLTLHHQLARLVINLTHLKTGDLDISEIYIGDGSTATIPTTAKFHKPSTGNIGTWGDIGTEKAQITPKTETANACYSAVLIPTTYEVADKKFVVIKTSDGRTYCYIPNQNLTLVAGMQYNYTISVKDLKEVSTLTIGDIAAYTYDGTAKTPTPTVKDGTKTLVKDTDYELSYSNNINAGTATVTVTGKGGYYSGSQSKNFTINKKDLTNSADFCYAATAITKDYIWELATSTNPLTNTKGVTVSYSSSVAGVATVNSSTGALTPGGTLNTNTTITATVTGSANYTGTATYTIKATSKAKSFSCTRTTQSEKLCKGTYTLQCWGASGGGGTDQSKGSHRGLGGYSYGNYTISNSTATLFVFVGGEGQNATDGNTDGGWNGGGNTIAYGGSSGGGMTHISTTNNPSTPLIDASATWNTTGTLIVAGGGGGTDDVDGGNVGAENDGSGGYGGGTSGGEPRLDGVYASGKAGTQTSGYKQGMGMSVPGTAWDDGGGGGGWWGGYWGGGRYYSGGGGGSGYIGGVSTPKATIAGNTSFVAPGGGNETGHAGDGYARITWVSN